MSKKLRILVIGAHPDDCEGHCGGTAAMWAKRRHIVRFLSVTNGQSGHHARNLAELVQARATEARAAAAVIGIESQVLPLADGYLEPTIANRLMVIRAIREFRPDLILTHRPNDYHPDHRCTSQLVQDSSYLMRVPFVAPETPALDYNPVIAYLGDDFQKPYPFQGDVVLGIDHVMNKKLAMMDCHASQYYQWLPWIDGKLKQVPRGAAARRKWLIKEWGHYFESMANRFRDKLIARYGKEKGGKIKYAEAFEACEYGQRLDAKQIERFFGGM